MAQPGARSDSRLQEDALDGMRGFAVLLVVLSHLPHAGLFPIPGLDLTGIGKPAVYLFFVLSAFLLTRQFLSRTPAELSERSLWTRYFARRFLRIFPLFTLVLVTCYLVGRGFRFVLLFPTTGEALVAHLTLREGKSVLWSIPPEFQYYFVLPLFGAACVLWKARIELVVAASAGLVALALWLWPPALAVDNAAYLGPYLPIFLIGSLSAVAHARLVEHAARWRVLFEAGAWVSLVAVALTIPSLYGALSGRHVPSDTFHGERLFYASAWSVFLVGTLLGAGACRAAFSARAIRSLGFISFSIYVWHVPVIRVVRNLSPLPPPANAWLALAAIGLVASASYLAVERPFQRLRVPHRARPPD